MKNDSCPGTQRLWYTKPAAAWPEALPAGNGRLGCMVFGGVAHEHIQLNEDSLWSGGPQDRSNPDARTTWQRVRQLMHRGQIAEAEQLALDGISGTPCGMRMYQPLGDLRLDFIGLPDAAEHYTRELDLEAGILRTSFSVAGNDYLREVFVSYPDECLVMRLQTTAPQGLYFRCRLEREQLDQTGHNGAQDLWFTGCSGSIRFAAALYADAAGGCVSAVGDTLIVEHAAEVTLYLTAATSYREADPRSSCTAVLDRAAACGYPAVRAHYDADLATDFHTMALTLNSPPETAALPTDIRLQRAGAGQPDAAFDALYFQYCRWLLFCSSRPGSLPANLQGVWNDSYSPPWGAKFTININLEMNYWPAVLCGLAACELPLFDHLGTMLPNGQCAARAMYGCRGFVAHHNTDLWGDCCPQDRYLPATFWTMGAAWLCTHIWQHYLYTMDRDFLQKMFPVLEQAVLFFEDFLELTPQGFYAADPSVSPENAYRAKDGTEAHFCIGPAMDSQILHELMESYLLAAEQLHIAGDVTKKAADILHRLPPPQIGRDGRLLEWDQEYEEVEPGHRHISHLYALTPGHQISRSHTPELAAAAEKALEYRLKNGGGHTGWSRAWIMRFWAHLYRAVKVEENLRALYHSSTFPNLMDSHPFRGGFVFQIDGNLGAAAAMIDCLVQREQPDGRPGLITLLPALPASWQDGRAQGIGLPGAVTLDLEWHSGQLTQAVFIAPQAYRLSVRYQAHSWVLDLLPQEPYDLAISKSAEV